MSSRDLVRRRNPNGMEAVLPQSLFRRRSVHPCLPVCLRTLWAVTQAGKPGRRRLGEGQGLVQGQAHCRPRLNSMFPPAKVRKALGQSARSAVALPFVLAGAALGRRSAPGRPSLQVLGFQYFQLPQFGLQSLSVGCPQLPQLLHGEGVHVIEGDAHELPGREVPSARAVLASLGLILASTHPRMWALPSGAHSPGEETISP